MPRSWQQQGGGATQCRKGCTEHLYCAESESNFHHQRSSSVPLFPCRTPRRSRAPHLAHTPNRTLPALLRRPSSLQPLLKRRQHTLSSLCIPYLDPSGLHFADLHTDGPSGKLAPLEGVAQCSLVLGTVTGVPSSGTARLGPLSCTLVNRALGGGECEDPAGLQGNRKPSALEAVAAVSIGTWVNLLLLAVIHRGMCAARSCSALVLSQLDHWHAAGDGGAGLQERKCWLNVARMCLYDGAKFHGSVQVRALETFDPGEGRLRSSSQPAAGCLLRRTDAAPAPSLPRCNLGLLAGSGSQWSRVPLCRPSPLAR